MRRNAVVEVVRLLRVDILAAIFAALLLPVWYLHHDWQYALSCALPATGICACGFILNNLYDLERDRENHPERPLPRGALSLGFASALYFALLAVSLVLVRAFATRTNVFLYLVLLLSTVNYNVVVAFLPALKNLFVGLLVVTVALLLRSFEQNGHPPNEVILALFLYFVGKEMLNDVMDAKGDGATLVKRIGLHHVPWIAFPLKIGADLVLLASASGPVAWGLAAVLCVSDIVAALLWRSDRLRATVVQIMRVQSVAGIYYLF
jgi:4-hydroxybenzoate polyprenyltransferase